MLVEGANVRKRVAFTKGKKNKPPYLVITRKNLIITRKDLIIVR